MKKISLYRFPLFFSMTAMMLAACGGGGGSTVSGGDATDSGDTNVSTSNTSYTISGTVPGTLIEAYCNDGRYFKANSTNDGSNQHPFSLDLPNDVICHLVMTTNENDLNNFVATPIQFSNQSDRSIAFTANNIDVELGYIPLAMQRSSMNADDNNDGVEDSPTLVSSNALQIVTLTSDPLDSDRDNIIDIYEDDDNDGMPNVYDEDDDGDGIDDDQDQDDDNDGYSDNDLDQDGISDDIDLDDDNDGSVDNEDLDDDNDGIPDDEDDDDNNDGEKDEDDNGNTTPPPAASIEGRLLASQCAQCHGTDGHSSTEIDSLAGESVAEIIEEMQEMKLSSNLNDIMHRQARGYTDEQVQLIANFFANQAGGEEEEDD